MSSIGERDMKFLWGRAAGRCSMPKCRELLCPYPEPGSILGEMAHIEGENPGAARYRASMNVQERRAYPNEKV